MTWIERIRQLEAELFEAMQRGEVTMSEIEGAIPDATNLLCTLENERDCPQYKHSDLGPSYQDLLAAVRAKVDQGQALSQEETRWLLSALDTAEQDLRNFAGQEEN